MTLVVTHPYVSSIAESTGSGVAGGTVGPNEWNANHTLTGVASPAQGGTGITSGTGVTYFSSATVIADSGTLTANAVVLGGGANGAPTVVGTVGTTSQVLFGGAGGGAPQWAAAPSGSGPGGTTGNVQFASSGSTFSGDGSFTYGGAGTGVTVKLSSSTSTAGISALSIVTSSSSNMASNASALNIASTFNNSATVYDAPLFMNVVNTASAANSAVIDIQQSGIQNLMLFNRTASAPSPTLTLGSSATATQILVYNTVDVLNNPTNYERGIFDWATTANVLTIGTQAGGTGTGRKVIMTSGNNLIQFSNTGGATPGQASPLQVEFFEYKNTGSGRPAFLFNSPFADFIGIGAATTSNDKTLRIGGAANPGNDWDNTANGQMNLAITGSYLLGSSGGTFDVSVARVAAKILEFGDGAVNANGWMNWAGESRVSANSTTTSTALANVPGLAFVPQASRNYSFEAHLIFTDAAAGGIQCTINATSTTTTYTLTFDGWVTDTTAVRGYAQGSAFGNVVASSLTTSTVAHVTITGTLMTSATAPSTVTIQFAQNTSNATPTTILIGSYMWAQDMP